MQNLAQLRAANAFTVLDGNFRQLRTKEGRTVLGGYAALIRNSGLLAGTAYSLYKGEHYVLVANAVAYHLEHFASGRNLLQAIAQPAGPTNGGVRLAKCLSAQGCDVARLMHCTEEALAFLGYLKHFAAPAAAQEAAR